LAIDAWLHGLGLAPGSTRDLGFLPNAQMPRVFSEVDVAVFPNRCEGGTNLVAMEAMACGVPTILSANTGHRDLVAVGGCMALADQGPPPAIAGIGTDGWGETPVEAVLEALESAYQDPAAARAGAAAGAEAMATWSWRNQIAGLRALLRG